MSSTKREYETGSKSWTSSRDSADGKARIIELDVNGETKTLAVRKTPLEPPRAGFRSEADRGQGC